jgi:hypothetical protein
MMQLAGTEILISSGRGLQTCRSRAKGRNGPEILPSLDKLSRPRELEFEAAYVQLELEVASM